VTFLRKTTQAVSALLVLLMSTMLVVPPGMDLVLCFGKDGYVDFFLNGCREGVSPNVPAGERSSVYDTAHHGECFDVAVACSTAKEVIRTADKTDSDQFKLKKHLFSSRNRLPIQQAPISIPTFSPSPLKIFLLLTLFLSVQLFS
jgi:hypothetical protein